MNRKRMTLTLAAIVVLAGSSARQTGAVEPLKYNRDIRPILSDNCFACHGADSASRKGDLRLDQREAAIDFGAITPGKVDESELIARITTDDPELRMPPPVTKKSLTAQQTEILKRWISEGAEYQPHWSFIPPEKPEIPAVRNGGWVKNEIDAFVLSKLEAHGLTPAPEAAPRVLFRRLHYDVTGLPPSLEETEKFIHDYQQRGDAALSDWIDRLMQRPAWGEHRARYWLDAARYGDTHGLHFDNYREIWPYRDWVIRAFNANMPFDQFVIEQLAGDLLPNPTDDQLIATGFQRCNITTNEGGTIDEENLALYATDRVQTFGWVFLGLTTNCGQCHDHKFDPFTMKDFYSLAAYFRNTTQQAKDGNVKDGRGPVLVVPSEEDRPRWKALPGEIAAAKAAREARRKAAREDFRAWLARVSPDDLGHRLPSKGLVLHVPLNEGPGKDLHNAVEPRQAFPVPEKINWIDGRVGPAPVIQSGNTFLLGDAGGFGKDQPFSYGAWVRTVDKNRSAGIIARMDVKASHRGWDLWQNGSAFAAHIIDSWPRNGLKVVTKNATVKPGTWQHVFVTYDGSGKAAGIRIYVDGRPQPLRTERETLQANADIQAKTPLRVGQRSEGALFEGGAVQDVRIYNRQLSEADVQSLARMAELRAILALEDKKRSPQQTEVLFNYYLNVQDAEYPALDQALAALEAEKKAIESRSPVTHIQQEKKNSPAMAYILIRGEYDRPGEQVSAAPPEALHPMPEGQPANRLGLANWLFDSANPLTDRVTVNRFWQQVFGQGIVRTTEDFGVMGALPSNQELLDWLAVDFRESGYDVQRYFKQILMSATYRQSAAATPEKQERDPDNALLSRGPRFRMDAEMIRDTALAVSGLLSQKMYGPGVKPYQPGGIWDIVGLPGGNTRTYKQDTGENLYRRTIYTFWKRMAPPPNMEAFNAPSREVCTVRRERTNTPLQALVTLNDPQFVEAARHLAETSLRQCGGEEVASLNHMVQRVLGREATPQEQKLLLADKQLFLTYYQSHPPQAQALISVGESPVDESLDPCVLAAWTLVGNEILNFDETLNK